MDELRLLDTAPGIWRVTTRSGTEYWFDTTHERWPRIWREPQGDARHSADDDRRWMKLHEVTSSLKLDAERWLLRVGDRHTTLVSDPDHRHLTPRRWRISPIASIDPVDALPTEMEDA
ncbi:hypothetical protein [Demequina maris]|uniref:hypothetical protein n=1 Tax=Demequina maris TaxID=1638982 RepID=UPI0007858386|nr:hypothetical protein [Demequina maris]